MATLKTSLVATILNEENTIGKLIDSIYKQSLLPSEVVIVDGGSTDNTLAIIANKQQQYKNILNIKVFTKKGNRSVGRNEGIKKSTSEIILITDSGCILDKDWIKEITKPFADKNTDVVAGYYTGESKNIFQKSLIPYVLVMPDKINEKEFLPATRSMAFKKFIWKKAGGFDEKLSHNEDYAFANRLKEIGAKISFAKNAVVKWIPRKNLKQAFVMFFRFAFGDIQAGLVRDKVVYLFLRYIFAFYIITLSFILKSAFLNLLIILGVLGYITWSIKKNYKYVNDMKAYFYLPLLQFTSDAAVILGTSLGFVRKTSIRSLTSLVLNYKGVFFVLVSYILILVSTISYGLPNSNHPFNYFMDEWHQSQSVRNLFTLGTPNVEGSANGSIFQFFLTGLYLIPFQLLGFIDVFAIKSSVTNLDLQFRLFEVLRLNTILFGSLSIVLFSYISKKYFKFNAFITAFLFAFNPVWIVLSGYFKYDIALMFWILITFLFLLRFINSKSKIDFIMSAFFAGITFSVKLSAIALLPVILTVFFLFSSGYLIKFKNTIYGATIFTLTFIIFGIPDILLGKGSLNEYITSNIVNSPLGSYNYYLGMNYFQYLTTKLLPTDFGFLLYFTSIISAIFAVILFLTSNRIKRNISSVLTINKNYLLTVIFFCFFAASLIQLKLAAGGNRALVLLPFLVIGTVFSLSKLYKAKNKYIRILGYLLILLILTTQLFQSLVWIKFKLDKDPREVASVVLQKQIAKGELIGIENIPIYQMMPDIVVKEFYLKQYNIQNNNNYKYLIVNSMSNKLPKIIIVSNDLLEKKYLKVSDKKDLVLRLEKEKYHIISRFSPDFEYFKHFGNELDFYLSAIVLIPNTITIYEK